MQFGGLDLNYLTPWSTEGLQDETRLFLCAPGIFLIVGAGTGYSQVTTATIYGNVTHPTGAVIQPAPVSVSNEQTGATASTLTNNAGDFTLSIQAQGFKTERRTGLELAAGQSIRLTFALELGTVSDSVTVNAASPIVNAANAEQHPRHTWMVKMTLKREEVFRIGYGTLASVQIPQFGSAPWPLRCTERPWRSRLRPQETL